MAERKVVTPTPLKNKTVAPKTHVPHVPLFYKNNYQWMIIGGVVVAIGMLLMMGGKTQNPNQFDYNSVYSTTRITIAPILILGGLMIEIYAIFKKPKVQQ